MKEDNILVYYQRGIKQKRTFPVRYSFISRHILKEWCIPPYKVIYIK